MGALGSKSRNNGGGEANIKEFIEKSPPIVVFASPTCGFCTQAITLLQSTGYTSQMTVINASSEQRRALRTLTGISSVPSIWLRGIYVGGCNDGALPWHGVVPMIRRGEFQKMLDGENPYA